MKKFLPALAFIVGTLALLSSTLTAAEAAPAGSLVAKNDHAAKAKPTPTKTQPSSSRGGNPPAHSHGLGRAGAPGQVKKNPPSTGTGDTGDTNGTGTGSTAGDTGSSGTSQGGTANPRSVNENKKVTFCHVPPGNPENGHVITTSVNAITPGHTNHENDIIPPFSYVKHGQARTFPGQNWGPDAQAVIDRGCKDVAAALDDAADPVVSAHPALSTETLGQDTSTSTSAVAGKSASDGGFFLDGVLPRTGGARLGVLLAGLALLLGGAALMVRRRRAV